MKYGEKGFVQDVTICHCMSTEHQFVFTFDPDTEDNEYQECYLDVHLFNPCSKGHRFLGFLFCGRHWRRVWYGIRYIFGYQSRYGAWDSTVVSVQDARKIRDLFDKYVKFCESKDSDADTDSVPPLPPSK